MCIYVNICKTSVQHRQMCGLATSPEFWGEWIVGDVDDRCWETGGLVGRVCVVCVSTGDGVAPTLAALTTPD